MLGAIGLVLPAATEIAPGLARLAATCLATLMGGCSTGGVRGRGRGIPLTETEIRRPECRTRINLTEEEMFITIVNNRVYVTLSRRNLRQLDAILDRGVTDHMGLAGRDENGVSLVVHAEEDSEHYEGREPGPG